MMHLKQKRLWLAACMASVGMVSLPAVAATTTDRQTLEQARLELANGDAKSALKHLLPLEYSLAGDPGYDALLGEAALKAGQGTRAVMAFERCLAVQPDNGDCRLGMARAHMALDEKQAAHDELLAIQESSPPPAVAKVVEGYLGELAGTADKKWLHAWAGLALGYDSNTNVAPASGTIALPGTGGLAGGVFSSSVDGSAFERGTVGMGLAVPMGDNWQLLAGVDMDATSNFQVADNSYFDSVAQVGGYLGPRAQYGRQSFGLLLQAQNYQLGGENYRNMAGVTGQYSYQLSGVTRVSGFVQRSRFDYQYGAGADLQNLDSTILGASLVHSLNKEWVVFGGFYVGSDDKVESAANDNIASDYLGLRGGATWLFRDGWQAGGSLLAENRDYDGKVFLFPDRSRSDDLLSANLNLVWQAAKQLSLRSDYSYVHNGSNVPIREYDRHIISLGVRYDFL